MSYPSRWLAGWLVLRLTLVPVSGSAAPADPLPVDLLPVAVPLGEACFSPHAWRESDAGTRSYLESMARANRSTASVRSFVRSLIRPGRDPEAVAHADLAAREHAAMLASAPRSRAEQASRVGAACGEMADRRLGWIRLGAAGVVGLVGAAGAVVASGATGTMGAAW